jgi:hypothetical protein
MNSYNVTLKYEDRSGNSEPKTVKVEATNIAGAVGRAVRDYVKSLDRKQRFDANKGLHVEAVRLAGESGTEESGTGAKAAEASA